MALSKFGWSVQDWCNATSLGRTKTFSLIADGTIKSVSAGRRRIITTQPSEYLESLASQKQGRAA
jgi:hypothetical protein